MNTSLNTFNLLLAITIGSWAEASIQALKRSCENSGGSKKENRKTRNSETKKPETLRQETLKQENPETRNLESEH